VKSFLSESRQSVPQTSSRREGVLPKQPMSHFFVIIVAKFAGIATSAASHAAFDGFAPAPEQDYGVRSRIHFVRLEPRAQKCRTGARPPSLR
jgi:hypothetical protein